MTVKSSKGLPANYYDLPLYGHWFAIELYNILNQTCTEECTQAKSNLRDPSRDLKMACKTATSGETEVTCRGFMASNALKISELTWSATCTEALRSFLFSGKEDKGTVIHQAPTRKQDKKHGNPELTDVVLSITKLLISFLVNKIWKHFFRNYHCHFQAFLMIVGPFRVMKYYVIVGFM